MEMKSPELQTEVKQEKVKEQDNCVLAVKKATTSASESIIQQGIKIEQDSAQIYEAMSAYLDSLGFTNASKWFKIHASEERKHSDWVIDFLKEKNILPILPGIDKPDMNWKSLKDVLKSAYEHEEKVTAFWNKAATECFKSSDHDSYQFCLYVLKEQREELDLFSNLIDRFNLVKEGNLLTFDENLTHP